MSFLGRVARRRAGFTQRALRRRLMELVWRRLQASRGGGWAVMRVCGASEPAAPVTRFPKRFLCEKRSRQTPIVRAVVPLKDTPVSVVGQ